MYIFLTLDTNASIITSFNLVFININLTMIFSKLKKNETKDSLTNFAEVPNQKSSKWPLKLAVVLLLAGGASLGVHYAQKASETQPVIETEVADELQDLEDFYGDDQVELVAGSRGQLEIPYDSTWIIGSGLDSSTCGRELCNRMANPFGVAAMPEIDRATENDVIKTYVVKTVSDEAKEMGINGEVEFSGWGASAKANIALKSSSSLKSNEVKFVAQRKITYGFRGWQASQPMSKQAKDLLCKDQQKFHDTYGDYFVAGYKMGSMLKFEIRAKTETSDTNQAISGGLEADFSEMIGPDATAKGSVDFEANLKANKAISSHSLDIQAKGAKVGYTYNGIKMTSANAELLRFSKNAMEGTGIATVIRKYDLVDDYIHIVNDPKCNNNYNPVIRKVNKMAEDKFYENIFSLLQLQGWIKDERGSNLIPRDKLVELEMTVLEKLIQLKDIADRGVTFKDLKAHKQTAKKLIKQFNHIKNELQNKKFEWSIVSSGRALTANGDAV